MVTYCLITLAFLAGAIAGYATIKGTFQEAYTLHEMRKYVFSNKTPNVLLLGTLTEINMTERTVTLLRIDPYDLKDSGRLRIRFLPENISAQDTLAIKSFESLPTIGTGVSVIVRPENGTITTAIILPLQI